MSENIEIKCDYTELVSYKDLKPSQGKLKKLGAKAKLKLMSSIQTNGFILPFVLFEHLTEGRTMEVLDGHQRLSVIPSLEKQNGLTFKDNKVPVIYLKAKDRAEAMKMLLHLVDVAGHVTKDGLAEYLANNEIDLEYARNHLGYDEDVLSKSLASLKAEQPEEPEEPEFPITPKFGEKYTSVIVVSENELDDMWLKNYLGLTVKKDHHGTAVELCRVITASELQKRVESK